MIVQKSPHKFQLLSRKTGRVLGTHPSYAAALRQERAIKASQARAARRNPRDSAEDNLGLVAVIIVGGLAVLGASSWICGQFPACSSATGIIH